MNNFLDSFKTAVIGFDKYGTLTERSFLRAVAFACVICVLSGFMIIMPFAYKYISIGGLSGIIEKNAGDFSIEDGIFYTENKYDGILKTDIFPDIHIVIDSENDFSGENIPDLLNDFISFGVYKDKVFISQPGIRKQLLENSEIEKLGINNKDGLISFIKVMQLFALLFVSCVYFTSSFMEILIAYLTTRLVCSALFVKLGNVDIAKICIYARTMPIILFSAFSALSLIIPHIIMPYAVYVILYAAYIFMAVKNYKKAETEKDNGQLQNVEGDSDSKTVICDIDNFDSSKFK